MSHNKSKDNFDGTNIDESYISNEEFEKDSEMICGEYCRKIDINK